MKRRVITGLLAATLTLPVSGVAALAEAPLADHNCVGHYTSASVPKGNHYSGLATASGHLVVEWVAFLRGLCSSS